MGRNRLECEISQNEMCTITSHSNKRLMEEVRQIAKSKGMSVRTLVEIYLQRAVKDYKTQGF